jgi:hypothetical protein
MKGQQPPESGRPKARRVSQRKELVVVTLGMVAAISGVGGLMAANSPSWASADEPAAATVQQTTAQQQAGRQAAEQGVRQAPQKAGGQTVAARDAAACAETARQQEDARQAEGEKAAAEQAAPTSPGTRACSWPWAAT